MAGPSLTGVAFVFPGQGSQVVGMGQDLVDALPAARALFDEADAVLGYPLSRIILQGPEEELRQTANTQPALLLVSVALYQALDLRPAVVAGHSLGEYSALVAAGALRFDDAIRLVHHRGQYMQEAVPAGQGAMFALLGVELEPLQAALATAEGVVEIANYNAPGQLVIAGEREATAAVAARAGARKVVSLAVSAPFHCRLMQPAEQRLAPELDRMAFADLAVPLYNNVDAQRITTGAAARDGLKRQVSRPVRWTEAVQQMIAAEHVHTFVEVGPGTALSGLIRRTDGSVKRLSVHNHASVASVHAALLAS